MASIDPRVWARVRALAQQVSEIAGRRVDALAKADPRLEMARIHVDDLEDRLLGMAEELHVRRDVGLDVQDILQRASRMAKACGGGAGPTALVPSATVPIALVQFHGRVVHSWLQMVKQDLTARERAGLSCDDRLKELGRVSRALFDTPDRDLFVVGILANCVEHALRFRHGQPMQAGRDPRSPLAPVDHEMCAAIGLAAQSIGVAPLALHLFATSYPEHAARLDRPSLESIVTATLTVRNGAQWEAAVSVAKARFGMHVSSKSVEAEMKRWRTRRLGPGRPPEAH